MSFRQRAVGPEKRESQEQVVFGPSFAYCVRFMLQGQSGGDRRSKSRDRSVERHRGKAEGRVSVLGSGDSFFLLWLLAGVHHLLCAGGARAVSAC